MSFEGQTIIVTGAAGGIGLETARQLLDQGANVAMLDLNGPLLSQAAENLGRPDQIFHRVADSADSAAMETVFNEAAAHFGRLDGLVANAGVRMLSTPFTEVSDEQWDNLMRVNIRGTFVAMRAAARIMKQAKTPGSMVTVASISGLSGRINQSAYATTKAAVIQLSKALSVELAEHQIRVNSVCPGTVNTPMFQKALAQDGPQVTQDRIYGSTNRFRPGIPLRRIAESEDVAAAIVFLLSEPARHITGQALAIDGGETAV